MHVLFLAARFHPLRGGVETHVYKVSKELIKMGHAVSVVTEMPDPTPQLLPPTETFEGIHIIRRSFGKPGRMKKFRIWMIMMGMWRQFRAADVIHCHDVFIWYAPLRFLMPFKRVFTTFHGYETVIPPARKAVLIRRVSNWLSKGSIHVGRYLEKWYGTRADVTLYGGVDAHHASAWPKHKVPHSQKRLPKIVLIGRLEKDIGIDTYVSVFRQLRTEGLRFILDVCGDGRMRPQLEEFGTVHGFVADVKPFIQAADIVCAASYLTILDALSYGAHVCAVYENELKKDALCMTPFAKWVHIGTDPKEMAEYIQNCLEGGAQRTDEDIHTLSRFIDSVTWPRIARSYIDLWHNQPEKNA